MDGQTRQCGKLCTRLNTIHSQVREGSAQFQQCLIGVCCILSLKARLELSSVPCNSWLEKATRPLSDTVAEEV